MIPWLGAWLAVWLGLTAWRWDVARDPPYCDFAIGLFVEADWLDKHDFDYGRLRYVEPPGNDGGPRVYMTSVLPTLVAMLFRSGLSQTGVQVVLHLANFACAAALLVMAYALVRPLAGKWGSLALVAAIVTTPLFSVQVEMIGLDLPMATFAVAAALLALRGHYGWAALAALASFAMKNTGLVGSIAIWLYVAAVLGVALASRQPRNWWRDGLGFVALSASLTAQWFVFRWGNTGERLTDASTMPFEFVNFANVLVICPDLVLLTLVLAAWTSIAGVRRLAGWRRTQTTGDRGLPAAVATLLNKNAELMLAWIIVAGGVAAVVLVVQFPVPRYFTIVVPFLYVIAGALWFHDSRRRPWAVSCVAALVVLNLLNREGDYFPEIQQWSRNGPALERSHEYLDDHRATIRAMREVAEKLRPDEALVVGAPFAFYLALPRLGYVESPLSGYVINPFATGDWPPVAQLFKDHPRRLMFVVTDNIYYGLGQITVPMPDLDDAAEQIEFDDGRESPLVVYRRDLRSIATSDAELEAWYLDHLWYDETLARHASIPLLARAQALVGEGFQPQAVQLLRRGAAESPPDPAIQLELARLLIERGEIDEGLAYAHEVAWADDENAVAFDVLGLGRMQQNQVDRAIAEFESALEREPDLASARLHLATAYLRKNDAVKAEAALRALLARDADHADARYQLGMIAALTGKFDDAVREFDELLRRAPERADAAFSAGLARMRQQRNDEAEQYFRDALARRPDYVEAKNYLGLMLLGKSQFEPAERLFREAIAKRPQYAEPYNNLAVALARTDRLDEAETQLRAALQLDPNYAEAYNNLGMLLARRDEWSAARDCFVQALQIRPDHVQAQQNLQIAQAKLRGSLDP
ncbi:MAG: tetratricopeptide repeat protein [Pirellulales bacterium]